MVPRIVRAYGIDFSEGLHLIIVYVGDLQYALLYLTRKNEFEKRKKKCAALDKRPQTLYV